MNAYTKIRAALEMATGGRPSNIAAAQEALAALAELERAAAEPVAWRYEFENRADRWDLEFFPGNHMPYTNHVRNITPLYAAPPAPVAEIREPTPEECADMAEWFKSECAACCINPQESADYGRAIFDAVKIVMWPKSEAK